MSALMKYHSEKSLLFSSLFFFIPYQQLSYSGSPKSTVSPTFSQRSAKLPVSSASPWLEASLYINNCNTEHVWALQLKVLKLPPCLHPCHKVKRLGHGPVRKREEAKTHKSSCIPSSTPGICTCLTCSQSWSVAWPASLRDTLTILLSISFSEMLRLMLQNTPRLWWGALRRAAQLWKGRAHMQVVLRKGSSERRMRKQIWLG